MFVFFVCFGFFCGVGAKVQNNCWKIVYSLRINNGGVNPCQKLTIILTTHQQWTFNILPQRDITS